MQNRKHTAVDSFRLRIETKYIKFTEKGKERLLLQVEVPKVNSDSLSETEFKNIAYTPNNLAKLGIKTKFAVVQQFTGYDKEETIEVLEILVNSKLLKERYKEGIHKHNLRNLIEEINKIGLIELDMKTIALYGMMTDIDIKADFYEMPPGQSKEILKGINEISKTTPTLTDRKQAAAIQYSYRHNSTGYISKPFIKLYHKGMELMHNSTTFKDAFLSSQSDLNNVLRVEGQIKNKKHLNSLIKAIKQDETKKWNIVGNFFSLTDDELFLMIQTMLSKHIDKKTLQRKNVAREELPFRENCLIVGLNAYILSNGTIEGYIEDITTGRTKSYKSKTKALVTKLYQEYLSDEKELINKQYFTNFMYSILG